MSNEQPVDWGKIRPEEWALGFTAVAKKYGTTRQAAHSAKRRLDAANRLNNGRPKKPLPADFDPALSLSEVMRRWNVSRPTAVRWRNLFPQP